MKLDIALLSNKLIPYYLGEIDDILAGTSSKLKEKGIIVKWHEKNYFIEHGFFITSHDKKIKVFFGIWFSFWEYSGNPLCICLELGDEMAKNRFSKCLASFGDIFGEIKNYEGYMVAPFSRKYSENMNDIKLVKLVEEFCGKMNLNIYFSKDI